MEYEYIQQSVAYIKKKKKPPYGQRGRQTNDTCSLLITTTISCCLQGVTQNFVNNAKALPALSNLL